MDRRRRLGDDPGHAPEIGPRPAGLFGPPALEVLAEFRPARSASWGRLKDALDEASGVTRWRLHDLRRRAATGWQRLGVEPHLIEQTLGPALGGVAGIYQRHRYDNEIKAAFCSWADRIDGLMKS
jgi:hypothetical protein